MEKFGKVIVKLRIPILILSFLLLIPSAIGYFNTRVNYDILYYLPNEIETMQGQDILMADFNRECRPRCTGYFLHRNSC